MTTPAIESCCPERYAAPEFKMFALLPRRIVCSSPGSEPNYGEIEDPYHQYLD